MATNRIACGQVIVLALALMPTLVAGDTTVVTGTVQGYSTIPPTSDVCAEEELVPMPYARVEIGDDFAFADASGAFEIATTAELPLTLRSPISGQFFYVTNLDGSCGDPPCNTVLEFEVTSGTGSLTIIHNEDNGDEDYAKRAEVNAYVCANELRDFVLNQHEEYPDICTQGWPNWQMEIQANHPSYWACYGGWDQEIYDGYIMLREAEPSPGYRTANQASLTIIAHEYGHHLEHAAGLEKTSDAYREGMSDTTAVLASGQPILSPGWSLDDCEAHLRTAENSVLAPCPSNDPQYGHCCGTMLSGAVWHTLNALIELYDDISDLDDAIDSLAPIAFRHISDYTSEYPAGSQVTSDTTEEFLDLDDELYAGTNGLEDGTPHFVAVCRGFGRHGLTEDVDICEDCNHNGIPDICDLDCSGNCDVPGCGQSPDANTDGYPDECECHDVSPIYVDANAVGAKDGGSWTDAFPELQDALTAIEVCGTLDEPIQVWVAAGTYTPDGESRDRWATFKLLDGAGIYGGFDGTETALNERDVYANETILSGDLDGDDEPGFVNTEDNCFHVVIAEYVGETAVLDGFTIRGGRADFHHPCWQDYDPTYDHLGGGGLYVVDASPKIVNCTVRDSFAGLLAPFAGVGGGAHVVSTGEPGTIASSTKLVNCTFTANASMINGGGLYVTGADSTPELVNCLFSGNTGWLDGGAVYAADGSELELVNCTFHGNRAYAGDGGAVLCDASTVTISNSILWGDTAYGSGPEIEVVGTPSSVTVTYSDVQLAEGVYPGTGNINENPLFMDEGEWTDPESTPDDPFDDIWSGASCSPQGGSPANDAGSNSLVPGDISTDIDGYPRRTDDPNADDTGAGDSPIVDMGAYEYLGYTSARSCNEHGEEGTFCLELEGTQGSYAVNNIENRQCGVGEFQLELNWTPQTHPEATAECDPSYTGTVTTAWNGDTATVTFDPELDDQQVCTVSLEWLPDRAVSVCVRTLRGDINFDGIVTTGDASIIKPHFGEPADEDNFHFDFDCSGLVSTSDYSQVKPLFGNEVEECAEGGRGGESGGGGRASEPPSEPWKTDQAGAVLEVRAPGGKEPVTVLAPNTTYEVHYLAEAEQVNQYVLFAVATAPEQGITGAAAAPAGPWSATGNFDVIDLVEELGGPLPAPAYPDGYFRYTMVSDEFAAAQDGREAGYPGSQGHLCNITTRNAGELNLHLYMGWSDQEQHLVVEMEAQKQLLVTLPPVGE